jgi:hypothetical protein
VGQGSTRRHATGLPAFRRSWDLCWPRRCHNCCRNTRRSRRNSGSSSPSRSCCFSSAAWSSNRSRRGCSPGADSSRRWNTPSVTFRAWSSWLGRWPLYHLGPQLRHRRPRREEFSVTRSSYIRRVSERCREAGIDLSTTTSHDLIRSCVILFAPTKPEDCLRGQKRQSSPTLRKSVTHDRITGELTVERPPVSGA